MIDFEFCIDTGNSPPVCCRQPVYGFRESEIMTKLIADIEVNKLIKTAKVLEVIFYYLYQSLVRKVVPISQPSFRDFVSAIDL